MLIPTVGMFVAGYLLVVSREHIDAMAFLGHDGLATLEPWLRKVISKLEREFGPYLIFEHGSGGVAGSGGCISHAHFHLVPVAEDVFTAVMSALEFSKLNKFMDLTQYREHNYVLLGRGINWWIVAGVALPGQWIRRILVEQLGITANYDWAVYDGSSELHSTLRRMGSAWPGVWLLSEMRPGC